MPNYRSHLDSPSKQALQMYLDDLTTPYETEKLSNVEPSKGTIFKHSELRAQAPSNYKMNNNHYEKKEQPETLNEVNLHLQNQNPTPMLSEDEKLIEAKNLVEKANALSTIMLSETNAVAPAIALDMAGQILQESKLLDAENKDETAIEDKEIFMVADNHTKNGLRSDGLSLAESLTDRFQVLLCQICGVTIAIPLVELGSIMQITKFTNQGQKQSWFKGLFVKGDQTYTCIDMSAQIAPHRYEKNDSANEYRYLVQLGKSDYALCCNNVETTLEIEKPDVKWRSDITKQPWLAGMLKDKMCALVDGAEMVRDVLKQH